MAKSSKHSRSEGNSLPPAKRFDFTIVDDDFKELQRSFVPKETKRRHKKMPEGLQRLGQRKEPSQQINH